MDFTCYTKSDNIKSNALQTNLIDTNECFWNTYKVKQDLTGFN